VTIFPSAAKVFAIPLFTSLWINECLRNCSIFYCMFHWTYILLLPGNKCFFKLYIYNPSMHVRTMICGQICCVVLKSVWAWCI
jgi:hypothetical protein